MRKQPPPVAAVAVCLPGWLNVSIPAAGQLTRQYLVDPLKADVFVAGTYRAESDCVLPACVRDCVVCSLSGGSTSPQCSRATSWRQ